MRTEVTIEGLYGRTAVVNLESLSKEFLSWAVTYATKQSSADAQAGKANTNEGRIAYTKKWDMLTQGIPPMPGRGSSARVSRESEVLWAVVRETWKASGAPLSQLDKMCKPTNFQDDSHKHFWMDHVKEALERASKRTLTLEAVEKHLAKRVIAKLAETQTALVVDPD